MKKHDDRPSRALQMILEACVLQRYVPPYDVVVSDARGTRIAARFDHNSSQPLDGDLGSVGVLVPPLGVFVTDARGEGAAFSVALLDSEDGQMLPPIITYPKSWIKPTPGSGSVQ